MTRFAFPLALLLCLCLSVPVAAQHYNQDRLDALLYSQRDSLDFLPEVNYHYFIMEHPTNNSIYARHDLYAAMGNGDIEAGREMVPFLEFLTRTSVSRLAIGDTIILPDQLGLDLRAYAPFPRFYEPSVELGKVVILHKGVQAWAAYEDGRLMRWGLANTGRPGYQTPGGRYNFNWQTPERVSSESPPGQQWLMRWVMNFYNARGFHMHQYAMPTGAPASHGCVRMIDADAQWLYNWIEPWVTTAGRGAMGGNIIRQGTMLLVLGDDEEPDGAANRFIDRPGSPELIVVDLPEDPYSVAPGTSQQRHFDRIRTQSAGR